MNPLYIVDSGETAAPWFAHFLYGLRQGLEALGRTWNFLEIPAVPGAFDEIRDVVRGNFVFLPRHTLYAYLPEDLEARVLIHEHDTYTPYSHFVTERSDIAIYHHPAVKAILCNTESMAKYIRSRFHPLSPVYGAGFPYSSLHLEGRKRNLTPWADRERLVVFPQRISPEMVPHMAAKLSFYLMNRGYNVTWCAPAVDDSFPLRRWSELGINILRSHQDDFYDLAAQARYAITTCLNATMSIALYEASLLGCRPLAPSADGEPPFTDAFWPRFNSLNFMDAALMVLRNEKTHASANEFSPKAYTVKLVQILTTL